MTPGERIFQIFIAKNFVIRSRNEFSSTWRNRIRINYEKKKVERILLVPGSNFGFLFRYFGYRATRVNEFGYERKFHDVGKRT